MENTSDLKLTGPQFKRFRDAIIKAFPSWQKLEEMVRFGLDQNIANIVPSADTLLDLAAFKLIAWAESYGQIRALLNAALAANNSNPYLQEFADEVNMNHPVSVESESDSTDGTQPSTENTRPRIMVSGGKHDSDDLLNIARLIGKKLISANCVLMSNGSRGVDTAALDGAFLECTLRKLEPNDYIKIYRPINDKTADVTYGSLHIVGNDYEDRRDFVINASNVIVLVGGGTGTRSVIQRCSQWGKPLIPTGIGAVDRAAVELWHQFQNHSYSTNYPLSEVDLQSIGPEQHDLNVLAEAVITIALRIADSTSPP